MPDDTNESRSHELHVAVFEMAQVAEVVHGCGRLLSSREQDDSAKRLGAILERAAKGLLGSAEPPARARATGVGFGLTTSALDVGDAARQTGRFICQVPGSFAVRVE